MAALPRTLQVATLFLTLAGTAGAACGNTYYPVREGLSRTYRGTVNGQAVTYSETIRGVSARGFTLATSLGNTTVRYACGAKGVTGTPAVSTPGVTVKSLTLRGVTQPPALKVGTTWTSGVTLKGTAQGQAFTNDTSIVSKVVGRERVRVPAGTFDALKVQTTTTVKITAGAQSVPATRIQAVTWVAAGVGTVKSQAAGTVIELVKVTK